MRPALVAVLAFVASFAMAQTQQSLNQSPSAAQVPPIAPEARAIVAAPPEQQRVVIDRVPTLDVQRDWLDSWQLGLTVLLLILTGFQLWFSHRNAAAATSQAKSTAAQLQMLYATPCFELQNPRITPVLSLDRKSIHMFEVHWTINNTGAALIQFKGYRATATTNDGTPIPQWDSLATTLGVNRSLQIKFLTNELTAKENAAFHIDKLILHVDVTLAIFDPIANKNTYKRRERILMTGVNKLRRADVLTARDSEGTAGILDTHVVS